MNDCQHLSGGAFRWGTMISKEAFTLVRGTPKFYRKIAESGAARLLAFCGTCGTGFYGTQADEPKTYSLRLGTARQSGQLCPTHQIWTHSALPWLESIADLPKASQPLSNQL